jgi:hypothetical protein
MAVENIYAFMVDAVSRDDSAIHVDGKASVRGGYLD